MANLSEYWFPNFSLQICFNSELPSPKAIDNHELSIICSKILMFQ